MNILAYTTLAIFLLAYFFIATNKINQIVVALSGAVIFIVLRIIDQESAFMAIDWNTIFLLVSMMIIINIAKTTGVFQYIAIKTAKICKGEPIALLIVLPMITAILSMLLDNVTTIVLLCPIIILIAVELGVSPVPFIICSALASNIGGTATLIGDPPNVLIGSRAGLTFMDFIYNAAPDIVIILIVFAFVSVLLFKKQLSVTPERKARIMRFDESKSLEDKPLLIKCCVILALTVVGFVLHGQLHLEASTIAMIGSTLLLLICGKDDIDEFFKDVEWGTILFFIGLFIMVQGVVDMGWIKAGTAILMDATKGNMPLTATLIIWLSGVVGAFVNNIPYVATMIPVVKEIVQNMGGEGINPLWWALSLGACLGGNGTLVASSAGVISASICTKNGFPIKFMDFTKYGALITVISLAITTGYVLIRYYS
ncbi:MAG: ArsB/NhaD family transporter [Termitinemataceae bacterium]|nr:MAG: ArsB/NhaD family transporter [Termitinemataceae bacterium]